MKNKVALILACLATAFPAALKADTYIESNVSFAFKLYYNFDDATEKGKTMTLKYSTVTLKNADIIALINNTLPEGEKLSVKSPILRLQRLSDNGSQIGDASFLVRDKNRGDVNVSDHFSFNDRYPAIQGKISNVNDKLSMTLNHVQLGAFSFVVDPMDGDSAFLELEGIDRTTMKGTARGDKVILLSSSKATLAGYRTGLPSTDNGNTRGTMDGSYKISGAKVVTYDVR